MTATSIAPVADTTHEPLNSRAVVVLTALAYFFVGLSFSYLDRQFLSFGFESLIWGGWTLLGFGAAALHMGKPAPAGRKQWVLLGSLGLLFAVFPGFAIYNMLRLTALTLMIVIGARAAILRTRRDFHLTLTVIFVVSFLAGTHGRADWTLWFYLGPAWVFGGLALAWDHAHGAGLSRATKAAMTMGFIGTALVLAMLIFFLAPRPPVLGFGFLPPGTESAGMFQNAAGGGGEKGGRNPDRSNGASGSGSGSGRSGDTGDAPSAGWAQRWNDMLASMRRAAADRNIPQWQRNAMGQLLNGTQTMLDSIAGLSVGQGDITGGDQVLLVRYNRVTYKVNWPLLLALLLLGCFLWLRRYRIGMATILGLSWLLARLAPERSMRLSAQAMHWCLRMRGQQRQPGQSVREYWSSIPGIDPLARRWMDRAMETYCEMRFGLQPAVTRSALNMHEAVQGTCDILMTKAAAQRSMKPDPSTQARRT